MRPGYYAHKGSRRVLEGTKGGNLRGDSREVKREVKRELKRELKKESMIYQKREPKGEQ